jgi:hypothetical protein
MPVFRSARASPWYCKKEKTKERERKKGKRKKKKERRKIGKKINCIYF